MKRIITLIWLSMFALVFNTSAQNTTTCNAEFAIQFQNSNTVKFNPVITGDTPFVYHYWNFGDGSQVSQLISPTHTYNLPGTYAVVHTVARFNHNGVSVCTQSFTKLVIITQPCNLVANFSSHPSAANPLKIEFQNLSQTLALTDSITWTFGDGNSSHAVNPVHTYAQPGTYTVCLKIKRNSPAGTAPCVKEICKTIVVSAACNLQAYFSAQPDPTHPLRVKFTNLSVPSHATDSIKWTFGDGTSLSGLQADPNVANPSHTYNQAGTYTVCIRVKKNTNTTANPCVSEYCKTVVVIASCNLQAYFSAQPDPTHPLRIKFTNLSVPSHATDSIKWTMGDGTTITGLQSDPNVANPTYNYTHPGTYNVCIRVKKNNSTIAHPCVSEYCKTIVVTAPCTIQPNFSCRVDSTNPKKIHFTNLTVATTASTTATWTFGDGSSATTWNAMHEYAQPGRYIVCLRIQMSPNCVREKCDTILVPHPVPTCEQISKFKFEKFSNDNQKYKFVAEYINPNLQYTWTFGDGTGSQDPTAVHRYAQPGVYTACLTVWRGPNCASTTCKEIRVLPQINCDSVQVGFSIHPNQQMPNKVQFVANSTLPIIDQTWKITKMPASVSNPPVILHQNNPTYLFSDTGTYNVCLRAVTLGGCVKEICTIIRITHIANVCELQAFPNPTTNLINVNVSLNHPEMIHAYLYNSTNVLVREKHIQGVSGNNLVKFELNGLPAGLYTIKLIYGNKICYARFQKL